MLTTYKHGLARIVAPASEPLTLAEAKLYLRVDGNAEDTLITDLIAVAREHAESFMRRSLLTQTWQIVLADYAPECLHLPMGPVQEISEVRLIDQSGGSTVFNSAHYSLDSVNGNIEFSTTPYAHRIAIDYVTGHANLTDLPKAIRYGMLSHIATLYDSRGDSAMQLPMDSVTLYTPYREVSL